MTSLALASLWALILAVTYAVYSHLSSKRSHLNLPPGPKPIPLLGNARDFPPDGTPEFQHWLKHKDAYGPISSVTVMGMTLVIIHDKKMAHDLLEQSALKTSGRPGMTFANDLCGYERIVVCQGYTSTFRRYRKFLHQELGTKASSEKFQDAQEIEVNRQLERTLNEPERWLDHLKTTTGATALKMTYGYNVETEKPDKLVAMIEQALANFSLAAVPMAWAVDLVPILRHLPASFPGAGFQKTAQNYKKTITDSAWIPYKFVERQAKSQNYGESYVSRLIQQHTNDETGRLEKEDEDAVVWTAASLYGAASDTSVITLTTFTAAMILFPEVQAKAQEEIDRVIGSDRLPTFEDRENLPYVNALISEAMRWWPIAPMGFPHTAETDLEFSGYHIPKGAMLLPAVWWFLHDPDVYTDPERFDPERFLAPRNEPDPMTEAFGYGRRICPGRFFADAGLYLNIAQSLACFNFTKAKDDNGAEIEIDLKPKPGILTYPYDFQMHVAPRSEKHADLIRGVAAKLPREASDAEYLEY